MPRPMKTTGSHRHYRRHDVELALRVRAMLETEGLTLAGVKKRLAAGTARKTSEEHAALIALRSELETLLEAAGRAPVRPRRGALVLPAREPDPEKT